MTTKYSVQVDFENSAEEWWAALDSREPELAARLRAVSDGDAVIVTAEELEQLRALPGFADGPERARTALLVEPAKELTITLTNRPPVKIAVDEWPVIAEATDRRWDGEHEFQAFRKSKAALRVRQHADRRAIVYGSYSYDTSWQGERSTEIRRGEALEPMPPAAGYIVTDGWTIQGTGVTEEAAVVDARTCGGSDPIESAPELDPDFRVRPATRALLDRAGLAEQWREVDGVCCTIDEARGIVDAIWRVAEDIDDAIGEAGDRFGIQLVELAHRCIADLPAEEI